MKLAQKQIDYKIRQGLFFIIKQCGNTTFLRLFVCMKTWCSSCLKLLNMATMILSCQYRESLTWLLNTSEFLTYEKKISQSSNCSHSFMIPYSSCEGSLTDSLKRKLATNINSLGSRTHTLELTITLMITGLFNLSIMICHHLKRDTKVSV